MEINLDTNAIQDAVVRAIADSAIGEQVKAVIESQLTAKEKSWDSETILQKGIKAEVNKLIVRVIAEEIESRKEEIRALIVPEITDHAIRDMSSAAIQVMLGNLKHA